MKIILFASICALSFSVHAQLWSIGHRADEREFTENSTEAFRGAAALGADFAEHDLRITKDHAIIVHHDANLNTNEECGEFNGKSIADLTLKQVETCRFVKEKTRLPLFEDILMMMRKTQTGLLIELKDPAQVDVIRMLSDLDIHGDCAKEKPSKRVLNRTYQCFSKTIVYSFVEDWVEQASLMAKKNPALHHLKFLKLVPADQNKKLLLPEDAHYWNVDGVALELESMGPDLESMTADFQSKFPDQIKLLWSGDGKMDFARVTKLPVTGIIASDIRGLIDYQKKNPPK